MSSSNRGEFSRSIAIWSLPFPIGKLTKRALKKIIDYCYDVGITPIPQLSVLGHVSQSRHLSGKHAVLAVHPEFANIYEPIGWSYCMSSEKAEKILKDLIAELHEFFGNPPHFHIGCGEVYDMATCYKCRSQNPVSLLVRYLDKFRKFLLARGARTIIWHDMLLGREDPRWAGKIATGNQKTAEALGALDKSIIITDWQYCDCQKGGSFNTPEHFKMAGFDVPVCPWDSDTGILALAKVANGNNLFGFLQTTWRRVYGNNYASFFRRVERRTSARRWKICGLRTDARFRILACRERYENFAFRLRNFRVPDF